MKDGRLGIVLLAFGGIWLWSKRKEAIAVEEPKAPVPAKIPEPLVPKPAVAPPPALILDLPGKVAAAVVNESTVPEGFTGSISQLDQLEAAGITRDTEIYQEAADLAYAAAAAECEEDQVVAWTSEGGYQAMDMGEYAWMYSDV